MSWVRLDDAFFRHRKVMELTDKAKLVHLSALCLSSAEKTDGRLTPGMVKVAAGMVGAQPRVARQLVDAGVWEQIQDGFYIHDYLEYNPSAEQRGRAAESTKQRVADWRAKRKGNAVGNSISNGVTDGVCNAGVTPSTPTPEVSSKPPPYPPEEDLAEQALHRAAANAVKAAEASGYAIGDRRGFERHKLAETRAELGERAQRWAGEFPHLTPAQLGDALTNPGYANAVLRPPAGAA